MVEDNPLDLENSKEKQDEDNYLHQSLTKHPPWSSHKNINDVDDIMCYDIKPGDNAANWKIVLPKDLIVLTYQVVSSSHKVSREQKALSTHIYINDIIIVIYADLLITSSAIIAKEIN
jgi:hypothetical protein